MPGFFSRLSSIRAADAKKGLLRLGERDVIFYAMLAVAFLSAVLLIFDGYFFFVVAGREHAPAAAPSRATFSDREIDEVIRMLDERAEKFDAIMGARGSATNTEK